MDNFALSCAIDVPGGEGEICGSQKIFNKVKKVWEVSIACGCMYSSLNERLKNILFAAIAPSYYWFGLEWREQRGRSNWYIGVSECIAQAILVGELTGISEKFCQVIFIFLLSRLYFTNMFPCFIWTSKHSANSNVIQCTIPNLQASLIICIYVMNKLQYLFISRENGIAKIFATFSLDLRSTM